MSKPPAPNVVTLLGVGAMFGIAVGLGVFLGVLADDAAGTSPLLALLGTAVGILGGAAGAYTVIRPYTRTSDTRIARPNDDVRSDEQ